ncbi:MAG: hypothetical protein VKL59_14730 [Nostocaceae cyanobacterium]|nr:hypothetical protein [Nostocaceae cyanobacterium]
MQKKDFEFLNLSFECYPGIDIPYPRFHFSPHSQIPFEIQIEIQNLKTSQELTGEVFFADKDR